MNFKRHIAFILFFIAAVSVLPNYANAQDSTKHGFVRGIGVKSGVSFSHLVMKESAASGSTDIFYGAYATLFGEFLRFKNFNILTHLGFVQKGGVINTDDYPYYQGMNYDDKPKAILNYITFNIVAKGTLNFKNVHPYLFVGPRIDFLLRSFSKDEIYGEANSGAGKFGKNYGLSTGIGMEYTISQKLGLGLELQKKFNINPISDVQECSVCDLVTTPGVLSDNTYILSLVIKYIPSNRNN